MQVQFVAEDLGCPFLDLPHDYVDVGRPPNRRHLHQHLVRALLGIDPRDPSVDLEQILCLLEKAGPRPVMRGFIALGDREERSLTCLLGSLAGGQEPNESKRRGELGTVGVEQRSLPRGDRPAGRGKAVEGAVIELTGDLDDVCHADANSPRRCR